MFLPDTPPPQQSSRINSFHRLHHHEGLASFYSSSRAKEEAKALGTQTTCLNEQIRAKGARYPLDWD